MPYMDQMGPIYRYIYIHKGEILHSCKFNMSHVAGWRIHPFGWYLPQKKERADFPWQFVGRVFCSSSHNHGSVENGCISKLLVAFNCGDFPLNHDHGRKGNVLQMSNKWNLKMENLQRTSFLGFKLIFQPSAIPKSNPNNWHIPNQNVGLSHSPKPPCVTNCQIIRIQKRHAKLLNLYFSEDFGKIPLPFTSERLFAIICPRVL